ncbi:MAG: hypothetical protein AAF222_13630, partial [Pseudomonadota bacterium]
MHAYGSFNPNFYGVSQALLSPEMMDSHHSYPQAEDVSAGHDAQSDHDLERLGVVSALDHEIRHFLDALLLPGAMRTNALSQSGNDQRAYREPFVVEDALQISATALFKATAHLTQGLAIYVGQGETAFLAFLSAIARSHSDHLVPLQMVNRLAYEA